MMTDLKIQISVCVAITAVVFLPILFAGIWNKKRAARRRLEVDKYWMRSPVLYFVVGMAGTIFFYIITIVMVFVTDIDMVIVAIVLCITFFYEYGTFVFLFWEMKVEADALTIYRPPLPRQYIRFHDITKVRYVENRLMGHIGGKTRLFFYHDEKKLFDVGEDMSGFYRLLETFADKGKVERGYLKEGGLELNELKEEFSVTETGGDKVRATVGLAFTGGLFIAILINWEELLEEASNSALFCYVACLLFMIMELTEFLDAMLRRVTVTYRTISIRNSIGREKTYDIKEITKVVEKEHHILLFRGDEKIAKISKNDKNYALLEERLRRILAKNSIA